MKMIRVGIIGATGYTALELIKLLLRHPNVEITKLTSRDESAPHLSQVHPCLRDRLDLNLSTLDTDHFVKDLDCVFCCLPHAASAEIIRQILPTGIRVIDFSADYRLNDFETFNQWYNVEHPDPDRVGEVPYGIPELFREKIREAQLVANPGCFPTSALLPLCPLVQNGMIEKSPIIVDSKTGISGAGRKPGLRFHFPECNESVAAYGVGTHRHMPEIDHIVARYAGVNIESVFTPHVVSMDRGILSTIYVKPRDSVSVGGINEILRNTYRNEPFVRITSDIPQTKDVTFTNFCDISVRESQGMIVLVSAIDNLIKGASGAAVQNMNVMFGFDEMTALK